MKLVSTRDRFADTWTTTTLTVNGLSFGHVCEDLDRGLLSTMPLTEIRKRKVPHLTAIPTGVYRMAWQWSEKHACFVPWILDVPGFEAIEIHSGNKPEDTDGCQCPGLERGDRVVYRSRAATAWLYPRIKLACAANDAWYEVARDPVAWAARLVERPDLAYTPITGA